MPRAFFRLIFALVLVVVGSAEGHAAKHAALVIGNAAYRHTPGLANPSNDAADVAAALQRLGFDVIFANDLTKTGMDDASRRFARAADGADAALFYYAGHAMQFQGRNYLMPVDVKLEHEADLTYETAELDAIIADMSRARGVRIVVLDACRNNPLEVTFKRRLARTRNIAMTRGFARVERTPGLLIAFATQPGHVADDGIGRNSPFTKAFLAHMEMPNLEVGPLFRRVAAAVHTATGGKQTPELSISLLGEFYFAGRKDGAKAKPDGSVVPKLSAAGEAWGAIKDSKRRADFQAFIKRFATSFYADLARARLAELEQSNTHAAAPKVETVHRMKLTGKYKALLGGWGEGDLEIRTNRDGSQYFSTEIWYENGHSCTLSGTAIAIGGGWRYMDGSTCILELKSAGNGKVTFQTDAGARCDDYCGARASLDDLSFKRLK